MKRRGGKGSRSGGRRRDGRGRPRDRRRMPPMIGISVFNATADAASVADAAAAAVAAAAASQGDAVTADEGRHRRRRVEDDFRGSAVGRRRDLNVKRLR